MRNDGMGSGLSGYADGDGGDESELQQRYLRKDWGNGDGGDYGTAIGYEEGDSYGGGWFATLSGP